ncbi:MAG: hypothetical protein MJY61_01860 [Bacteroidales bacterium]|nr:hypothetical protein [Bacteroidales bacterium]
MRILKRIAAVSLVVAVCLGLSQESFCANVRKQKLNKLVNRYSKVEGFRTEKLGMFAVFGLKSMIHSYAKGIDDPRVGDFLNLVDGVESVVLIQYGGSSDSDRQGFDRQMDRLLLNVEPVMTVTYLGARMNVYVVYDNTGEHLEDVILYSADISMMLCLYGRMSVGSMRNLAS